MAVEDRDKLETSEHVVKMPFQLELIFALGALEYLHKGGRTGKVTSMMGDY